MPRDRGGCGTRRVRASHAPRALGVALLALLAARAPCSAATAQDAPPPVAAAADTAPLVLHGRVITVFRSALGASSPRDRAAAAERRWRDMVEAGLADSISTRPAPAGTLVVAGARGLFVLTEADTAPGGDIVPEHVGATVARLQEALRLEREVRSIPLLLRAAGFAAVATLAFFAVLRLLIVTRRAVVGRLPVAAAPRLRDVGVGGFSFLSVDQLLTAARRAIDLSAWAAGLFLAYLWLTFVLTRFAYSRPWGEALGSYLRDTVRTLVLGAVHAVPGLFTVVLVFIATRWVTRLVIGFFDAVEARSVDVPWVHPETANPTRRIVVALLWLFAIVVAYPYLPGSGSDVFKGVSVFAGLVISLGSSGVMNQAMSGFVLMYSRAFRPGDYVRIGETEGTVSELGMLSTKIRTTKREEITLPNSVVVAATVKNYSRLAADEGGVLLHTSVTIGYDTPWRQVEALLLLAARRTQGLRADPPPFVLQTALSDFYVEYQLNAVMDEPARRAAVLSALHAAIIDAFNEHGVQITSPHYEADPPAPHVIPPERWRPPPVKE